MRNPCSDRGARSKEEKKTLIDTLQAGCWRSPPRVSGLLRCSKSCRLRRINHHQRPADIKPTNFSEEEEDLIVKLHALLGNRWTLIAGRLPGRTDNEIKNHWNCHLSRKLESMGIDPNNHRVNQSLLFRGLKNPAITMPEKPEDSDSLRDDAESNALPGLNLELTLSLP